MVVQALVFYGLAFVAVASGVMVVVSRNPVHSVLFLILAFFNAAGLFVLMGAEFLAMILIVVYVGAVAVLFLFVVMMLDINFVELRQGFLRYLPIGTLIGLVLLAELILVVGGWTVAPEVPQALGTPIPPPNEVSNIDALGRLIYTRYVLLFQISGLVLLIAMIGAIVLTLRSRVGVKKQSIETQNARDPADVIKVIKVTRGGGV
ncbi:MAG: NADH-quinone oxidoreductase subunit J [Alphaproteobacteria bacterium]|nr:NADH-quinone oxidoreductase subunit J [Alphaproteobacteria bacterium]